MSSHEKKDLCVSTLAATSTRDNNGCSGVSIFPECTRCNLYYMNSNSINKRKGSLSKPTTDQK